MGFMQACVILSLIVLVNCASIPPWLQRCKLSDSSCLKTNAQNALPTFVAGIPELGVTEMEPADLGDVNVEISGLKLKFMNAKQKGWKTTVFDSVKLDLGQKELDIVLDADLTLRGNYLASGMLLILPISGEGDVKIKIKGIRVHYTMPFDLVKGSDGKDYVQLKGVKNSFEVKIGANFALTNLFYGNKQLSDIMHKFMNTNWKLITQEFAGPVMDVAAQKNYENLKSFFSKIPLDDITLQ